MVGSWPTSTAVEASQLGEGRRAGAGGIPGVWAAGWGTMSGQTSVELLLNSTELLPPQNGLSEASAHGLSKEGQNRDFSSGTAAARASLQPLCTVKSMKGRDTEPPLSFALLGPTEPDPLCPFASDG